MAILKLMHMKQAKGAYPAQHLSNTINYIFNPEKTEERIYVGGNHCPAIGAKVAYDTMVATKKRYNKETNSKGNCRQGYHFVVSFSQDEPVTQEMVLQLTQEFVKRLLDDYECVYAVHNDKDNLHSHIVFNSVSYKNGNMYHYQKGNWKQYMLPVLNDLCAKYGLKTLDVDESQMFDKERTEKGQNLNYKEWEERKKGNYTVLQHMQADIDRLVEIAESYEELLQLLVAEGYELRLGAEDHKHLSLKPPNGKKGYRIDKLGMGYTPEGLKARINASLQKRKQEEHSDNFSSGSVSVIPEPEENKRKDQLQQRQYRPAPVFPIMCELHSYQITYTKVTGIYVAAHRSLLRKCHRMTHFQRAYIKYYSYFMKIRQSGKISWQDSQHILQAQDMLDQIGYIIQANIRSPEDVERRFAAVFQANKSTADPQQKQLFRAELRMLRKIRISTNKIVNTQTQINTMPVKR